MPCDLRRRPNGSRDPVAFSPAPNSADQRVEPCRRATPPPTSRPPRPSCVARRRRVRFHADAAGSGSRSPSRPARAALLPARRCRPSMPCSSGNSNTMSVVEIRLRQPRRRAPRAPRAPAAPNTSAAIDARELLDALGLVAIAAELLVEDDRVQPVEPHPRASCLRSASQKNFASRSRAVTTRSAFLAISRSSDGCVFTTARNASFSSPLSVTTGK